MLFLSDATLLRVGTQIVTNGFAISAVKFSADSETRLTVTDSPIVGNRRRKWVDARNFVGIVRNASAISNDCWPVGDGREAIDYAGRNSY